MFIAHVILIVQQHWIQTNLAPLRFILNSYYAFMFWLYFVRIVCFVILRSDILFEICHGSRRHGSTTENFLNGCQAISLFQYNTHEHGFCFFFLRWRTERNGNIECQTYNIRALHFTTTLIRHTHSYTDCVMRNEHRTIAIYALKINTLTYLWHLSITVRKHMVCLHFLFLPFALYE